MHYDYPLDLQRKNERTEYDRTVNAIRKFIEERVTAEMHHEPAGTLRHYEPGDWQFRNSTLWTSYQKEFYDALHGNHGFDITR